MYQIEPGKAHPLGAVPDAHEVNFSLFSEHATSVAECLEYWVKDMHVDGFRFDDGSSVNWSWNCGVEGETGDPAIEALRVRQIKNFAAILLLSQGVPMLLAGDEIRRTQRGNNNAYCQVNEIGWFDWDLLERGDLDLEIPRSSRKRGSG